MLFPFPLRTFCTCEPCIQEKLCHMQDVDSKHVPPSEEHCLRSPGFGHSADTVPVSLKEKPPFYQASCFSIVRKRKSNGTCEHGEFFLQFLCCEVSSLVRGNAVHNTVMT